MLSGKHLILAVTVFVIWTSCTKNEVAGVELELRGNGVKCMFTGEVLHIRGCVNMTGMDEATVSKTVFFQFPNGNYKDCIVDLNKCQGYDGSTCFCHGKLPHVLVIYRTYVSTEFSKDVVYIVVKSKERKKLFTSNKLVLPEVFERFSEPNYCYKADPVDTRVCKGFPQEDIAFELSLEKRLYNSFMMEGDKTVWKAVMSYQPAHAYVWILDAQLEIEARNPNLNFGIYACHLHQVSDYTCNNDTTQACYCSKGDVPFTYNLYFALTAWRNISWSELRLESHKVVPDSPPKVVNSTFHIVCTPTSKGKIVPRLFLEPMCFKVETNDEVTILGYYFTNCAKPDVYRNITFNMDGVGVKEACYFRNLTYSYCRSFNSKCGYCEGYKGFFHIVLRKKAELLFSRVSVELRAETIQPYNLPPITRTVHFPMVMPFTPATNYPSLLLSAIKPQTAYVGQKVFICGETKRNCARYLDYTYSVTFVIETLGSPVVCTGPQIVEAACTTSTSTACPCFMDSNSKQQAKVCFVTRATSAMSERNVFMYISANKFKNKKLPTIFSNNVTYPMVKMRGVYRTELAVITASVPVLANLLIHALCFILVLTLH